MRLAYYVGHSVMHRKVHRVVKSMRSRIMGESWPQYLSISDVIRDHRYGGNVDEYVSSHFGVCLTFPHHVSYVFDADEMAEAFRGER
jgi:hypothetical protein